MLKLTLGFLVGSLLVIVGLSHYPGLLDKVLEMSYSVEGFIRNLF